MSPMNNNESPLLSNNKGEFRKNTVLQENDNPFWDGITNKIIDDDSQSDNNDFEISR